MKFLAFNILVGAALAYVVVTSSQTSGTIGSKLGVAPTPPATATAIPAQALGMPQGSEQPHFINHPVTSQPVPTPRGAPRPTPLPPVEATETPRPAAAPLPPEPKPVFRAPVPAPMAVAAPRPAAAPTQPVTRTRLSDTPSGTASPAPNGDPELQVADAGTAPTPPTTSHMTGTPVLAEGETLMSPNERRRELFRLAESMEMMYLRRVGK